MFKIAVIDDEPKIRSGITSLLTKAFTERADVRSFSSTTDIMKAAEKEQIDILVTDICMPDMDGLALGNYLKIYNPNLKIIIISGYSSFEYAKAAITLQVCEYLLKPINQQQLIEVVEKAMIQLKKEEVEKKGVSRNNWNSENILDEILYGSFDIEHTEGDHTEYYLLLADRLTEENDRFKEKAWKYGNVYKDRRYYIFTDLKIIEDIINNHEAVDFYVGVSEKCIGKKMLRLAYQQADAAIKQCIYDETSGIWQFKNTGIWIFDGKKQAAILVKCIIDEKDYGKLLKDLETEIRCERPIYPMFEKNMKIMLDEVVYLAGQTKETMQACMKLKNISEHVGRYLSLSKFFDDILKALEELSRAVNVMQTMKEKSHIEKSLMYIENHFSKDISLDEVALHVNMNAAYFSTVFKKYTERSFVNYVTELRINKAKELLKNDTLKIGDISARVGFNDIRYFAKVFKKYMGVTPSDYRNISEKLYKKE